MNGFDYFNPARVVFGNKPYEGIEKYLRETGVSSLMMIHTRSAVRLGIYDEIEALCKKHGIAFVSNGDVESNPKIELIRVLVEEGRKNKIDCLLAAGGGSVIDTAKAVAMGIPYDGDTWDFYDGTAEPEEALPVIAVSTVPSSGSETSQATIVSNGLVKAGYESEMIVPKLAVLNPEFTLTLPARMTACGISDILSHLMERYFTNTEHVDTTDYMIVGAAKSLMLNGERVI